MKQNNLKNVWYLTKFDLKNYRKSIIIWSVTIFCITFLYMILFPSVKEMGQMKLEAMPKELLEFVNMSSMEDLENYMVYYAMIISLIIIAISIFATTFTSKIINLEEKTKFIEFTNSLEISRKQILFSKTLTSFIAVLMVCLSAVIANFICAYTVGGTTFNLNDTLMITKITFFIPFFFMSIALFVSGLTGKSVVSGLASGMVFITYMMGYLSKLIGDKGNFLKYLSPFEMLSPKAVTSLSNETITSYGILIMVFIILIVLAHLLYSKRDFRI